MSKLKYLPVLFAVMLLGGVVGAGQVVAQETPVVKVGNVVITEDEIQADLQGKLPMISFHGGIKPEKVEELKKGVKDELITQAYQVNYALENEISVDGKTIDADWASFVAKNPGIAKATPEQVAKLKQIRFRKLLAGQAVEKMVDFQGFGQRRRSQKIL